MIEIQLQMKHNKEDITELFEDLDNWKSVIKTHYARLAMLTKATLNFN